MVYNYDMPRVLDVDYATVGSEELVGIYIIHHQIQYEEGGCGMVWWRLWRFAYRTCLRE